MSFMRKSFTILFIFVLILSLLSSSVSVLASEDEKLNVSSLGSLSFTYANGDELFSDVKVSVYRVADSIDGQDYNLVGSFENYPIDINSASTDREWQVLAYTLFSYVIADDVKADKVLYTDENGVVKFDTMKTGMYLVISENPDKDSEECYFNPFLISNPYFTNNDWYYDVVARPKMQFVNPSYGHSEYKIEKRYVAKRWKDDGYELYRPEKIEVDILKNGNVLSTQILSAENNWTYSWLAPDDGSVWTVVEKNVEDFYNVTVDKKGFVFNLTNMYKDTTNGKPSTDDEAKPDVPQPDTTPDSNSSTSDTIINTDNSTVQTGFTSDMISFMLLFTFVGMGFVLFGVVLGRKDK